MGPLAFSKGAFSPLPAWFVFDVLPSGLSFGSVSVDKAAGIGFEYFRVDERFFCPHAAVLG